jgi:tetratricopeptide (TPR) repeat protein
MSDSKLALEERFKNWSIEHPRQWHVGADTTGIIDFLSAQTDKIVTTQIKMANNIVVSQERTASEIARVAVGVDRFAEGLESLAAMFEWGFSELVWHLEEQRKVLQDILSVLQAPLDTQAKELKKRAEHAYRNGWFEDAVEDFVESEKKNRYDFTIHQNLGNIYLFEKKKPVKALEYYERAAKYATREYPYHAAIAFLHIGLVRYLQGNFQKAYEATSKALDMSPSLYEVHYQHAQYCANLGNYSEAIEHLKVAIEGDRFYCVKADSEKDFDTMKTQLVTLFEELRKKASEQAGIEIERARASIENCKTYGVSCQVLDIAENRQSEAETFLRRGSYFDCLDACHKAGENRAFILDSSSKCLSSQISETRAERDKNVQRCRERADSNAKKIFDVSIFSAVLPVFPAVLGVLAWLLTNSGGVGVSVGVMAWLFGCFLLALSCFAPTILNGFLYRRSIGDSEESYASRLAILERNLSDIRKQSAD